MESQTKTIIYQVFTRLYGNRNTTRKENGTIADNGCGKLNDFTPTVLKNIRQMGVSHIWGTPVSSATPRRRTTPVTEFPVSTLPL